MFKAHFPNNLFKGNEYSVTNEGVSIPILYEYKCDCV
jgi:hypothetical protein